MELSKESVYFNGTEIYPTITYEDIIEYNKNKDKYKTDFPEKSNFIEIITENNQIFYDNNILERKQENLAKTINQLQKIINSGNHGYVIKNEDYINAMSIPNPKFIEQNKELSKIKSSVIYKFLKWIRIW